MERLVGIRLAPGVFNQGTLYQAKGRWHDAHGVRWYDNAMGPIGGWVPIQNASFVNLTVTGLPRAAVAYRDTSTGSWLGVGTHTHIYNYSAGTLTDITPAGFTTGAQDGSESSNNYGVGFYGSGVYGTGGGAPNRVAADTWQLDNFGQYLVGVFTADGNLYTQATNGVGGVMTAPTLSSPNKNPTGCLGVVVTPERFLVTLGTAPTINGSGVITGWTTDGRTVAWFDQASLTVNAPTQGNQAGSFPLQCRGKLLAGRRTHMNTLLWTDAEVFAMNYVGGNSVYGFQLLGEHCGLCAPNGIAQAGENLYWISQNRFYVYDGAVKTLPCDVLDYVFGNMNAVQCAKVCATTIAQFNEIWWFYPGALSLENDRAVVYNYAEETWAIHQIGRGACVDAGPFDQPIFVANDTSGVLYSHEIGSVRSGVAAPYAISGPVEFGDLTPFAAYSAGDIVIRVQRYLPDENTLGDTLLRLFAGINPTDAGTAKEVVVSLSGASAPTTCRISGRYFRLEVYENSDAAAYPSQWRMGVGRVGIVPGGYR